MSKSYLRRAKFAVGGLVALLAASDTPTVVEAAEAGKNWGEYHGDYRGWRFSPLDQITPENISKLKVAWMHQPGDITHGLQATPIAIDGVLYYIAANNRVFAVDAASGKQLWCYVTELDPIAEKSLFSAYNRGLSVGRGKVYFGTLDGRAVAVESKSGKEVWATQLTNPEECNGCNFTSPPTLADDILIYGPTGGDLAQSGKIYAVKADTGERVWTFDVIKDDPASWPNQAIPHGGGGAWLPGQYDPETGLVFIGTTNAAPDLNGIDRTGDNLYTSTILAFEPKTGKLKWHHQEVPHDVWDFDSAYEFIFLQKDGKPIMTHLNKGGFVTVLERATGKVIDVWKFARNVNWVSGIDPKTGALIGRNEPKLEEAKTFCPSLLGARSWNPGAYNPKLGLWFTNAIEFCALAKVGEQKVDKMPFGAPFLGVSKLDFVPPPDGKATSRLDAVDPLTGKVAWSVDYALPGLGAVLATGGGLVFNGDSEGFVRAYDAKSGDEVWTFNLGSGIRSGIISYEAGGKQYVVVPSGFGSLFPGFASGLFPAFKEVRGGAVLVAFVLE